MNFAAIKIDYTYDESGNLVILDIGDGLSCSDTGFTNVQHAIKEKIFARAPNCLSKVILDGEIPKEVLSDDFEDHIVFSTYGDPEQSILPISGEYRCLSTAIHSFAHHMQSKNNHPSTLIACEMHKLYLYILRDQLLEKKRFVFWDASRSIKQTIREIKNLQIPSTDGFFVKSMDLSHGGAREEQVMYAKNFMDLQSLLERLARESEHAPITLSYAIEQTFSSLKRSRSGQRYVVTGRAFIMLIQTSDHEISSEVISAKYMLPLEPYQGPGNGSKDQFLANINQGQTELLAMLPDDIKRLSEQLNSDQLAPLWYGLFQPVTVIDEQLIKQDILIHQRFMHDATKRLFVEKLIAVEKSASKLEGPIKHMLDRLFVNTMAIEAVRSEINRYDDTSRRLHSNSLSEDQVKDTVARLSRVLALIKCHLRNQATLTARNHDYFNTYVMKISKPTGLEYLFRIALQQLLAHCSRKQTVNLCNQAFHTRIAKTNSQDTNLILRAEQMHENYIDYPDLNIHVSKKFVYASEYPTILVQAALLSDVTTLRSLLLSRVVDICKPSQYGYFAFFINLSCKPSKSSTQCRQILFSALRDKIDQWRLPQNQSKQEAHLDAIYECLFFRKLAEEYRLDPHLFQDSSLFSEKAPINTAEHYHKCLVEQTRLYISARNIKAYSFETLERTLRRAVVGGDADMTRMLILTGLANPLDESPSGKTAVDHVNEYDLKLHSNRINDRRMLIQALVKRAIESKHVETKTKVDASSAEKEQSKILESEPASVSALSIFDTKPSEYSGKTLNMHRG